MTASRGLAVSSEIAGGIATVTADRRLDRAPLGGRPAAHQGEVGAVDAAAAQHALQPSQRLVITGNDQQPGRVPVEPVDDPRPGAVAADLPDQPVDKRRAARARRRVHDQPGRLVDHQQPLVAVGHRELHLHRLHGGLCLLRLRELHLGSGRQPVALRPRRPVDQHLAALDQPLRARPRADLRMRGEEPVEPLSGPVRRHRDRRHQMLPGSAAVARSRREKPNSSRATPTTMKLSARLKVGQCEKWMKSVT